MLVHKLAARWPLIILSAFTQQPCRSARRAPSVAQPSSPLYRASQTCLASFILKAFSLRSTPPCLFSL